MNFIEPENNLFKQIIQNKFTYIVCEILTEKNQEIYKV